ncbi:vWA domain-containing protein [Halarcobacter ebronensis]|uniref:VWA domain-containing protein n=1 Tax=Halarcobacter ebronensis TaxID=1462615 RepID=A0A4Q1AJK2_9BACT|nr:VWA domain-containing protein [Halarcobacter ebronensis]QKF81217.1 von Willebrand factor type A (vWA) domain-containing protein (BatA domain), putative oxygen tolerance protein BatA [Halarcobacter ebronensis]RXK01780.1 VWA domain-containing protein [Halarcobacter ebronensis]
MYNYLLTIKFEYPYLLLLILLFIFCSIFCKAKIPTYIMPHLNIFEQSRHKSLLLTTILKYLVIVGSIIALSSPYRQLDTQIIKNDGIDIVLSLDTSGSMNEKGLNTENQNENRFNVVKDIVKDFIPKRVNDNIAIVVFGTSVMMATPLSFDKEAQKEIVDYLEVGIVGDRTAMIDSLASSVNILKTSKAKSKIVILLSDGEDNASNIPLEVVIKLLEKYSIKVYTVGIGNSNKIILNQISKATNGKSYIAYSKDDLRDIYNEIDSLEKSKIESNKITLKEYLFFYPLFLAILSLILYIYLKNRE